MCSRAFSPPARDRTQKTFAVAPLICTPIDKDESSLQIGARTIKALYIALHSVARPSTLRDQSREQELGI